MKKKKFLKTGILFFVTALFFTACGPAVPTKELEDAKTALERARQVEAPVYAANDYQQADADYTDANKFVEEKKNKEAQEKALAAKEKAEKAYSLALQNRAESIYKKIGELIQEAKDNDAEKINPEKLKKSEEAFEPVKAAFEKKDYEEVYNKGRSVQADLESLVKECRDKKENARNAIAKAQDKYDEAQNMQVVREFAKGKLDSSAKLLDEARKAFEAVDLDVAQEKAESALAQIQAVIDQANKDYQKYLADQKSQKELLELDRQKQIEKEKAKAEEYLKRASEMLKKIKNDQSQLPSKIRYYGTIVRGFSYLAQEIPVVDEKADTEGASREEIAGEEKVSEEVVQHYYQLAEEAYKKGEFLDSMDYSREAIRLAEILLAQKKNKVYEVVNNPKDRDCLWKISGRMYDKQYWMWPIIWKANKYQIKDPDLIYPGQKLEIPPSLVK